jgi:hypothetical protein
VVLLLVLLLVLVVVVVAAALVMGNGVDAELLTWYDKLPLKTRIYCGRVRSFAVPRLRKQRKCVFCFFKVQRRSSA